MFSEIIEAEKRLNNVLPAAQPEQSPPAALLAAAKAWSQAVWSVASRLGPMPLPAEGAADGRALAHKPVFIFGVHRSGTTLLRDLLDGHPALAVLPSEGAYLTNLEQHLLALPTEERMAYLGTEWLRRLANPINQPPYWLLGRSNEGGSPYVDFARWLVTWWPLVQDLGSQWPHMAVVLAYASSTDGTGTDYWVDKTPVNERFYDRLSREMPQARFIHIIRHPVDTLSSRKKMEPSVSFRSALRDLKMSFRLAASQQNRLKDHHYLLLRYEHVCTEPQATAAAIAAFLNIDHLPILGVPTVAGKFTSANSSFNKAAASGLIIKHESRGDAFLAGIEHQMLSAYAGKVSASLGYPLPRKAWLQGLYLRLRHRLW